MLYHGESENENEVAQWCPTLCGPMDCSLPGSSRPWDFPGKSTGVGCHFHIMVQMEILHDSDRSLFCQ